MGYERKVTRARENNIKLHRSAKTIRKITDLNKLNVKSSVGWRLKYFCQPLLVGLAGLVGVGTALAITQLVENKYFDYKL